MNKFFILIAFFLSTIRESNGSNYNEVDYKSVASTNPTLAEEQVLLKLIGSGDPDEAATCEQLIESRGFEYERYYVTTEDGYILQNFRIINPYARESRKSLKPVLLLHPLFTSCSSWLWQPGGHIKPWKDGEPPDDDSSSLGYLLANLGYDVWLINVRGTSYSTDHIYLDPKDPKFWDFSFYEIGIYDVTATVEQIKSVTGFESIIAIGHSQGTTQLIIQLSVMPEYEKNYDLVILAAPLGFLGDPNGIGGFLPTGLGQIALSQDGPFPFMSSIIFGALAAACEKPIITPVCNAIYDQLVGYDQKQFNSSRIGVYASLLERTSNKNIRHYFQFIEKDHLSYFDYGEEQNYALYGLPEPPEFPFCLINADKLILMSSLNDNEATPIDVQNFRNELNGRAWVDHIITDPQFNHADFVLAIEGFPFFGNIVEQLIAERLSYDG